MEIKIIDSVEKLLSYKTEWENILKEVNNDVLYLELDWIISWWKFFGDKYKLFVLITTTNQEVVGIFPLVTAHKERYNIISSIGSRESGIMDFILRDMYREEALGCICNFLRSLKGSNIIKFNGISEKSANYVPLREYLKVNRVPFVSNANLHYLINLKDNDFSTYFEHRFSKKTRERMNNRDRKLKRLGELNYKKISSFEMDELFDIYDKRWSRKIGNSSFSKGKAKEFYKELASTRNMTFNVFMNVITLNNRIISFMYGFEYNKRVLLIRIAHDDDFCFLSPGELVLKKSIEDCFISHKSVVDFGLGSDSYKAMWTDDYEEVFNISFPSDNVQSKLVFYFRYWTRIKLINALKKNKRIYSFRKYRLGKLKFLFSREHISDNVIKIQNTIDQNGLLGYVIKKIMGFINGIVSHKKYLILGKYLNNAEIPQGGLHVKEATIDDLGGLSEVMYAPSSEIVRRFVSKHECYITFYKNELIHYCWIKCSRIEISGVELKLPIENNEVHIYDTFMKRKYKSKNNYMYIYSSILNLLYEKNYKRCYIILDCHNKSFENEIYKEIFHPRYKVIEKRLFGKIKHNVIKLS